MIEMKLGLIGLGTVGTGVLKLLRENGALMEKKLGIRFRLVHIADRGIDKFTEVPLDEIRCSKEPREVLENRDVDIVLELIGGLEPARTLLLDAMAKGKSVVTANKLLLAEAGHEIFAAADKHGVDVGFEGSVAGTIPIIRVLSEGLAANRIERLVAILNGTSNYILTRMTEEGKPFDEALREAQKAGYAEADPTLDVSGEDAAHKLAILATLAFGIRVRREDVHVEGIQGIAAEDIAYAREFGYVVKLLAIGRDAPAGVELRVHPALVPKTHPLASVRNEFNAVYVQGDASRETMYYGRGAGQMPTASAVLSDVIELSERLLRRRTDGAAAVRRVRTLYWSDRKVVPIGEVQCPYYLRFPVIDKPGVIGIIASVLGQKGVSIAAVRANLVDVTKQAGTVEILTHRAREKDVVDAIGVIERNPVLRGRGLLLRIEEG